MLIDFCYDLPKNEGITNRELTSLFESYGITCAVQVIMDDKKPFMSARIQFTDEETMRSGLEKIRYFKIHDKCCRVMGYEPLLERNTRIFNPSKPSAKYVKQHTKGRCEGEDHLQIFSESEN
jgi:hypothetical protein